VRVFYMSLLCSVTFLLTLIFIHFGHISVVPKLINITHIKVLTEVLLLMKLIDVEVLPLLGTFFPEVSLNVHHVKSILLTVPALI